MLNVPDSAGLPTSTDTEKDMFLTDTAKHAMLMSTNKTSIKAVTVFSADSDVDTKG
jgi:hypothetical protein